MSELQVEIHQLSKYKGWYEGEDPKHPRWNEKCIALVHSELSEALECVVKGESNLHFPSRQQTSLMDVDFEEALHFAELGNKPEGLGPELADAAIRLLDLMSYRGVNVNWVPPTQIEVAPMPALEKAACISALHTFAVVCIAPPGSRVEGLSLEGCARFLNKLEIFSQLCGIDLDAMIRIKHEFNKTRPHRHGGKIL